MLQEGVEPDVADKFKVFSAPRVADMHLHANEILKLVMARFRLFSHHRDASCFGSDAVDAHVARQ